MRQSVISCNFTLTRASKQVVDAINEQIRYEFSAGAAVLLPRDLPNATRFSLSRLFRESADRLPLLGAQLYFHRRHILLQVRERRRPRNRQHHWGSMQQPRQA